MTAHVTKDDNFKRTKKRVAERVLLCDLSIGNISIQYLVVTFESSLISCITTSGPTLGLIK